VAALTEPAPELAPILEPEAEAEAEALEAALEAPVEEALAESEAEYEIVEEVVYEDVTGELAEGEEYEIVEEVIIEEVEEEPPTLDEPATLEDAVPEGDAFDRGLESLISGETAPGPTEDALAEPEPVAVVAESEPTAVAEPVETAPASATAPPIDITAAGLVKRTPKKRENSAVGGGPLRTAATSQRPTGQTHRSPEEVRAMLSRYRGGLKRGRDGDEAGTDQS
jgi:hypothetical protein